MADIKTKNKEKGTIKTLNKAFIYSQRMKETLLKAKDNTQEIYHSSEQEEQTEYATDKIINAVKTGTKNGINQIDKHGKRSIKGVNRNTDNIKRQINNFKEKQIEKKSINNKNNIETQALKRPTKRIKGIKNSSHTSKRAIKTSENVLKKTEKAVQIATKKAQKTAKMIRESAKAASKTAKVAIKAMIKAIKAILKVIKSLLSIIFGFSWIVVVIVVIVCLVGLLMGSAFGIFFSNEDVGNGAMTMSSVISELNQEFIDKVTQIQNEHQYKEYDINSNRAEWKDILAVYSVKINGGENKAEVVTLDEGKVNALKEIFWAMNEITFSTDEKTHEQLQIGWTSTEVVTVTEVTLHITVNSKTAHEMADIYNFNEEQRKQLDELLKDDYSNMWASIIYGTSIGSSDIVSVAEKEIGNLGGRKYWKWYGFNSRVEWCACYVSWCAEQCGYIEKGIIPKFASCDAEGVKWFKTCNLWRERGFTPNPGDIIFFDWVNKETGQRDGVANHVGIVEKVENGRVHTIEGNTTDSCARRDYDLDSLDILGYGTPNYAK